MESHQFSWEGKKRDVETRNKGSKSQKRRKRESDGKWDIKTQHKIAEVNLNTWGLV